MRLAAALFAGMTLVIPRLFAQPAPLIRVDVSAVDSHGRPVDDLQSDEIRILDDGKPQTPVLFQHWEQRNDGPVLFKPGEFANRPGERPCVVVVLNLLDPNVQRLQIDETLRAIQNRSQFCLYALQNQSGALQPIRPLPGASSEPIDPNLPALAPRREPAPPTDPLAPRHEQAPAADLLWNSTCSALDDLASQLAILPGRKSIVWIGMRALFVRRSDMENTAEGRAMADQIGRLLALLEAADTAVYSVNVTRPLSATPFAGIDVHPDVPTLSGSTGGRVYIDHIDQAIADSLETTQSGYRLFYAAPESTHSAPYHSLKLICERRGVTLTGKQGYDTSLATEPRSVRDLLDSWMAASDDATDIGIHAVAPAGQGHVRLDLSLDPADLLFHNGHARASIQVVDYTTDGRPLTEADPKRLELTRDGVRFPIEIAFNGSVTKIRILVVDETTHLAGTLTIPVSAVTASDK